MKHVETRVLDASAIAEIMMKTGLDTLYDLVTDRMAETFSSLESSEITQKERDGFLLTMKAWVHAGVDLPRVTTDQYRIGTSVPPDCHVSYGRNAWESPPAVAARTVPAQL